jgi:NTE family protein
MLNSGQLAGPSGSRNRIGLALSGGGSRAMAFHLGCLRALHELTLLERASVLSTISGGSVIGAYYAYMPQLSFAQFELKIRALLRTGFHAGIAASLFSPWNFFRCVTNYCSTRVDSLIGRFTGKEPALLRYPSRVDMFHRVLARDVFPSLKMSSPRRRDLEVVVGACELRTGSAFRFGNSKSGGWRYGTMKDGDVELAFAVAASAAYPIFLPPFDRKWYFTTPEGEVERRVLITDGGVYDNLGIQVLEPGRDETKSIHTFPCNYIIACNAGHGQDSGECIPLGFIPRVSRSFEIVHRRVQDSTMHRLHHLKEAGKIKGFILPYLGQQDNSLPATPPAFVSRAEVLAYPTDFAAMSVAWIDRLSDRGEQLTKILVAEYLQELLN